MNEGTIPLDEPLRTNLKAHLIACGSSAAWEAALKPYSEELEILDDEAYERQLQKVKAILLEEAENATLGFTKEEYQEIATFEVEKQLEALRKDMLTVREIKSAIFHFGEYGYREARLEVEQQLSSHHPELRAMALEILILYWDLLFDYRERVFQFLTDPDPGCRRQGLCCLNPQEEVLEDLATLQAYARIVSNMAELPSLRLYAYGELLTSSLSYDSWGLIHCHLEDGGKLEQAPWIDWSLVRFLSEESQEFHTMLTTEIDGAQKGWPEWTDQHGKIFLGVDELGEGILLRVHHLALLRFSEYQMIITIQPRKQEEGWLVEERGESGLTCEASSVVRSDTVRRR